MRPKPTVCLNMIVKNEMANLERCLSSVAPFIDAWVIGDTGSTDGTQDFIRDFFADRGIPGELHEFAFVDFAQARNEALERARSSKLHFDYLLFDDADMELVVEDRDFASKLDAAAYSVLQRAGIAYWNVRLVARKTPSLYKGVTHEFLDVRQGETRNLQGVHFVDHATGSNRPEKFDRDVRLLTAAIAAETDPGMVARYTFYLANTHRDGGRSDEAIAAYRKRAGLGHWQEEVFISLLSVAELGEALEREADEVLAAYQAAADAAPWRAEAWHGAARFCRAQSRFQEGYAFARRGLGIPYPSDSLFVSDWVYDYGLLDELAISAYWAGAYEDSIAACDRLLSEGMLPTDDRARIEENRKFAETARARTPDQPADDPYLALIDVAKAKETSASVDEVLAAYEAAAASSPSRAEALCEASRFCRARGLNNQACAFVERGLQLPRPDAAPGLQLWVYDWGLAQELSIAGYYQAETRARAFAACDRLALSRDVPEAVRVLAQNNRDFYLAPAAELMPSFVTRPVGFEAPTGFQATNPSITRWGDDLVVVQRTVNYTVDLSAPDDSPDRYRTHDGGPVRTRNFLLRLDADLAVSSASEILPPEDLPAPAWPLVQGFEDLRAFAWKDELWGVACVRQLTPEGRCEQVLARVAARDDGASQLTDWRIVTPPGPRRHEKNWMPFVEGSELRFLYLCDPTRVVDEAGGTVRETVPSIDARGFRGGSQLIAFDGGWLALVHETEVHDAQRWYRHRFVWFDHAAELRAISRPFFFRATDIEFAAGLAWRTGGRDLVVSYGVRDAEAWIATVEADDVATILDDVSGPPGRSPTAIVTLADNMSSAQPRTPLTRIPLALCAIFKDEALYIEEWVAFHALQGVEVFVLFDNGSTDDTRAILGRIGARCGPLVSVEVVAWPGDAYEAMQLSAYGEGARRLAGRADWVGFVDIDEFLFASAGTSLPEALAAFGPEVGAEAVGHRIFGSSGQTDYNADLVTARFTRCSGPEHPQSKWFKTLARPERVSGFDSAHSALLTSGEYVMADHGPLDRAGAGWHPGLAARIGPGEISLNHYMVKSREEFGWKQRRFAGKGLEHRYNDDYFREHDSIGDEVERQELAALAATVRALIEVWRRQTDRSPGREGFPPPTPLGRTELERELTDLGFAPLADLAREARLRTWSDDPDARRAQLMQLELNVPLIFLATLALVRGAAERGWEHILFSARDGLLWSRLYDAFRRQQPGLPSGAYFYTSRTTRVRPSADYLAYFDQMRVGRRTVVADLCGTGWSLSRLIERAGAPATDVFLVHQLEAPEVVAGYAEATGLPARVVVEALIRRPPRDGDNDMLEELNRAPHAAVIDVRRVGETFEPVFSPLGYDAEAAALVRAHHQAFAVACRLVESVPAGALVAMAARDPLPAIARVYARFNESLAQALEPLLAHKLREEPEVWAGLAGEP